MTGSPADSDGPPGRPTAPNSDSESISKSRVMIFNCIYLNTKQIICNYLYELLHVVYYYLLIIIKGSCLANSVKLKLAKT